MSAASDVTVLRQIVAQYAVDAANMNAWSTNNPIQTTSTIISGGSISAGAGLKLPASYVGIVTLASGAATVTTAASTTSSYIFLTNKTFVNQGLLRATPGNGSFIINSASVTDASLVQWLIINPA
jgi:uncharacterized membrane protein YkgB